MGAVGAVDSAVDDIAAGDVDMAADPEIDIAGNSGVGVGLDSNLNPCFSNFAGVPGSVFEQNSPLEVHFAGFLLVA